MYDYFGHGFHTLSVIKHLKECYQIGDPGTKSYQMGVRGLICVSLGVLEVKKFENHWFRQSPNCR